MTGLEILGIASTVCAIVFGYLAFARNKKKDTSEEATLTATILSDIGYIKSGVDDIKTEQKDQRATNLNMERRLTAVEESTKQAHKRIDELKKE